MKKMNGLTSEFREVNEQRNTVTDFQVIRKSVQITAQNTHSTTNRVNPMMKPDNGIKI